MAGDDERRHVVEVPYVQDPYARQLMEFLARVEALSRGEAPLWVRGLPEPDWSRAARDPLPTSPERSHAVDILSGAAAREVEIAMVCRRIIRRVSPIVREEIEGYLNSDESDGTRR